jgi:2,4'-dihydroxyacetophenone dioxygenase
MMIWIITDRTPQALHVNKRSLPSLKDFPAPGIESQLLAADIANGFFVVRIVGQPGAIIPTHLHTGIVHAFTLSGKWQYREYPDSPPNTSGSYLLEPAGSRHTLEIARDAQGPTEVLFVTYGALLIYDEKGAFLGVLDAGTALQAFSSGARLNTSPVIVGGEFHHLPA